MAYSRTTWSNDTTPVNANNLNNIEDALVDQDARIDENNIFDSCTALSSGTDLNDILTPGAYEYVASETDNVPLDSGRASLFVIKLRRSANVYVQIVIRHVAAATMYIRYYTGEWYAWRQITTTAVS